MLKAPQHTESSSFPAHARRCTKCLRIKPLAEFRLRYSGTDKRHGECGDCFNKLERERRLREKKRAPHRYAQTINRNAHDALRMAVVTSQMVDNFRGVDGLAQYWKAAIDEAASKGKNHLVVRSMVAITNLAAACHALEQSQPRNELLEDQDLQHQLEQSVVRLVSKNPRLVLDAAEQLGWRIIPPDDVPGELEGVT